MGGKGAEVSGKEKIRHALKSRDQREKKNKTGDHPPAFFDSFSSLVSQSLFGSVFVEFSRFPPSMSSGDLLDDPSAGRVS